MTIFIGLCLVWGAAVICAAAIAILFAWVEHDTDDLFADGWWHTVIPYVIWFVFVCVCLTWYLLHHAGLL